MVKLTYMLAGIALILVVTMLGVWLACQPTSADQTVWAIQFGTTRDDNAIAVRRAPSGNLYVTGSTDGDLFGTGAGEEDLYVAKYTPGGQLLWSRQIGSPAHEWAGLYVDQNENLYLYGETTGELYGPEFGQEDAFVVKMNQDGTVLWAKQVGTPEADAACGVAVDGQGSVFVAYSTAGSLFGTNSDLGYDDLCLAKYDKDGNLLWSVQIGTEGDDVVNDITLGTDGCVYVTGHTGGLFGTDDGVDDVFIAKYSPTGQLQWGRQYTSSLMSDATAIRAAEDGSIYVGGWCNVSDTPNDSEADGFLARYDSFGNQLWKRVISSPCPEGVQVLALGPGSQVYAAGFTTGHLYAQNAGEPDTYQDVFVVRFDQLGSQTWSHQFGTCADDWPLGMDVGSQGVIYICGVTRGSLYGTNLGKEDAFLATFSQ